ncbi:hypothetical protein BDQ12DRAFT_731029 [Crucibulum laeve]|uniref:FAD-binding PCMH-type domain-containing protein n=1 Tax=Crucibulum laeve TaxID=68775 RepID=A0A5C3MI03_9AGAR|nr:hypothetical protein BDQ12DRAFT_731029 [Crucibulum laeve]
MNKENLAIAIKELRKVCEDSKDGTTLHEEGTWGYKESSRHYLTSSSDAAAFAIQPGSEKDLAEIIKIIGKHKILFAVKGGGHSMVPGFSSTLGCQISMARFDKIKYNKVNETMEVGAGCLWDRVYKKAAEEKRGVVGGASAQGVGVAGWMLGGGYSLKTNKYGLGIDNVKGYRIACSDGNIRIATKDENPDLYQALRGGANNFGIVTQFTLVTHKQGTTYGASLMVPGSKEQEMKAAIVDHIENEKRKEAALVTAFRHNLVPGKAEPEYTISALCVFDAPKPSKMSEVPFKKFRDIVREGWKSDPAGWVVPGAMSKARVMAAVDSATFVTGSQKEQEENNAEEQDDGQDDLGFREMSFNEMQTLTAHPYDVTSYHPDDMCEVEDEVEDGDERNKMFEVMSSMGTPFMSLRVVAPKAMKKADKKGKTKLTANLGELNARGRFGCIMVSGYTAKLVEAVAGEAKEAAKFLNSKNGRLVLIDVWPFLPTIFEKSPEGAAWPHKKDEPFSPLLAYFLWENEDDDEFWLTKMKKALNYIRNVALEEGCTTNDPPYYLNTSLEDVPVKGIYRDNLAKLSAIRAKYDPEDVMGNTGGFKIPLPT